MFNVLLLPILRVLYIQCPLIKSQLTKGTQLRKNEGRVYFAFDGDDFNPNEITKLLKIQPTNIRLKNSLPSGKLPKFSSWIVSSDNIIDEIIDIYDMTAMLVKTLESKVDVINEIKQKFNVTTRLEIVLSFSA